MGLTKTQSPSGTHEISERACLQQRDAQSAFDPSELDATGRHRAAWAGRSPGEVQALVVLRLGVAPENVLGNPATQPVPFFDGMTEEHAAKDARVVDLPHHVLEARERAGSAHDGTADGVRNVVSPNELRECIHHRSFHAAMIGRIPRVARRHHKRYPRRNRRGRRVRVRVAVMGLERFAGNPRAAEVLNPRNSSQATEGNAMPGIRTPGPSDPVCVVLAR